MAIKNNITLDQGSDFFYNINLVDGNSNPFDVSSYTGMAQLRVNYAANTCYNMNVTTNSSGLVQLTMHANTTSQLTKTRYVYDVMLISSSNVVSRIVEGFVTVNLAATRR